MKNLADMFKQARDMQGKLEAVKEKIAALSVRGVAGGDAVAVTLGGDGRLKAVEIDPDLMTAEDKPVLEDLLVAAHNDAKSKLDEEIARQMSELTGGMSLPPGFDLPLS